MVCLLTLPVASLNAQESAECDPAQVTQWLSGWQGWVNATNEVAHISLPGQQAVEYFVDHFSHVSNLSRPECVADTMHATAYWYSTLIMVTRCGLDRHVECAAALAPLLPAYEARMNSAIVDLAGTVGFRLDANARPEGWSLGSSDTAQEILATESDSRTALFSVKVKTKGYVRTCASTACARVAEVTEGQILVVIGRDGSWYEVEWGGRTGFINVWFTTRLPDSLADLYEGYVDLKTGCILALHTRRGSGDLNVIISGEQRDDVWVDVYLAGNNAPFEVSAQYDKTFIDTGEPYIHQSYYSISRWPKGDYEVELRLAGKASRIGFSIPESGDHTIFVMCD
jgi:hypothetical protein